MEAVTMTQEEFMQLRSGDVVLIRTKLGVYRRTVITGPADFDPPHKGITVPIRHRSWTRRGYTCLFWNDIKHKLAGKLKTRTSELMNKEEIFKLLNWCDKPSSLIERELKERHKCGALEMPAIRKMAVAAHKALKGVGL